MRISSVEVYGLDLTYVHGQYVMSGGRVIDSLPTTYVRVVTDEGIDGWGEVCPVALGRRCSCWAPRWWGSTPPTSAR
jgi:L-alanine-DL-glutamate epimerase-like enolase superfamily enzyme